VCGRDSNPPFRTLNSGMVRSRVRYALIDPKYTLARVGRGLDAKYRVTKASIASEVPEARDGRGQLGVIASHFGAVSRMS